MLSFEHHIIRNHASFSWHCVCDMGPCGCVEVVCFHDYIMQKYVANYFFIHSTLEGYLGCFQFLSFMNNSTINSFTCVSGAFFLGTYLRSTIARVCGQFIFERYFQMVFKMYLFTSPPPGYKGSR